MEATGFSACAIVPVFNHEKAVPDVIRSILALSLPVIIVDDGSSPDCQTVLQQMSNRHENVRLVALPKNRGKGAAVKSGLLVAQEMGFSHAIQIDADGQHTVKDATTFLAAALATPEALVCGFPQYDVTVPKLRFYARYLTHVWVWINSLSLSIKDTMCGFRVYPVTAINRLIKNMPSGDRMEFDSEIMVYWVWQQGTVINLPTAVSYPADGESHFKPWRDNYLISKMHARLFFGMLWRLPSLLTAKLGRGKRVGTHV